MSYSKEKIENTVLALLGVMEFGNGRFWKNYDFGLLDSLYEKGYITNPVNKNKSCYLTPEGLERAKKLAEEMFGQEKTDK